ncbi:MAG TPA: hypothetical protein EYP33_06710, partial [Pyrodictium sp.]|nr:hypothetical protein [Pyrodictium sp.]
MNKLSFIVVSILLIMPSYGVEILPLEKLIKEKKIWDRAKSIIELDKSTLISKSVEEVDSIGMRGIILPKDIQESIKGKMTKEEAINSLALVKGLPNGKLDTLFRQKMKRTVVIDDVKLATFYPIKKRKKEIVGLED